MTRLDTGGRWTITNHVQLTCDTMTPKYYEYLHSGYVPIMWPYRHVFRAMPRRRALRHAGRRAIPLAHGPRIVRYTRSRDRKHRRGCICTPDILIHSTIHTDYIIGLCRVDRPSNWPSYPTSLDPIEITRFNTDDSGLQIELPLDWSQVEGFHDGERLLGSVDSKVRFFDVSAIEYLNGSNWFGLDQI